MANNKPVAFLMAIIESPERDAQGRPKSTRFVQIAAFFNSKNENNDNLTGRIECEPLEWRDPRYPRRTCVQFVRGQ
jgi:hypothetical protein